MADAAATTDVVEITSELVSAYLMRNYVPAAEIPGLIASVHAVLVRLGDSKPDVLLATPDRPTPAVPIRKSVTDDYLVCLEDGKKFKSLKRHLRTQFDMSPEDYREKWGLPLNYPIVAPNYAKARSQLAKDMGLGQQRRKR